jgi:hypothetical protein
VQKIIGFDRYAVFDSSDPSDRDLTAARGRGGTGGGAGAGGDSLWRQAAADSPDLAVNCRPGSVSRAGCIGRMRALRGMHLGAWLDEMGAGEGRMAAELRRGIARAGRQGRGTKRGWRCSLPQRGAPGALARRREAARRAAEVRRRACAARVCEVRAPVAG